MIRVLRRFDPHSIRLLIFDLDGTLVDSRLDLIHSVNATLRHFGRPELEGDVIASYVGDGAPALVRRSFNNNAGNNAGNDAASDAGEALFTSALEYFLGYYRVHKLDHTTVYEGIPEALAALAAGANGTEAGNAGAASAAAKASHTNGSRLMAVLSNKPVHPSRDIVKALGLGDYFVRVYGGNSFATKKPDPLGVRALLEETGAAPSETLIIGDSAIDVKTGRNAGIWTCGVTYGFAPQTLEEVPPDVLVERPSELSSLFP